MWTWCIKDLQYLKNQETLSVARWIIVWNGLLYLFGAMELLPQRYVCETERSSLDFRPATSASRRRKLQRTLSPYNICTLHACYVTSWSSAAYIFNFHLQRHFLAWSLLPSCMWWVSGTRIFRNTKTVNAREPSCMLIHLFLEPPILIQG